jgi:hypothetical protein
VALASVTVTAEAAVRYDGGNLDAITAMGCDTRGASVRFASGEWGSFRAGDWVIRYGPADYGVMSGGAFRRYFGAPTVPGG